LYARDFDFVKTALRAASCPTLRKEREEWGSQFIACFPGIKSFGLRSRAVTTEIPFDFAQGRLSLRLKSGFARDDNPNLKSGFARDDNPSGRLRGGRW
jgi:hypothetical protein